VTGRHAEWDGGDEFESWQRPRGIFVIAELDGPMAERVLELQQRFDPKLAAQLPPHVTLIGSSGAGPIAPGTSMDDLRAALGPIAASTPPLTLPVSQPTRFMQTDIVVLPLDPHGPLRVLHDRVRGSGLRFGQAKFTFTPHVTLSFYRTLTNDERRELLAVRITDPVHIGRLQCSLTNDPQPPRRVLELDLTGPAEVTA
jgi:2'-5' RNA ligase